MKEILNYSKKEKFIPNKFFNNFLKPQLENKKKMAKKDMLQICEEKKKYNSFYTLSSYLHKLEINGQIKSDRIKNKKYYMLR